ncbi:MAG: hypothetical protein ACTSSQ_03240 [Alphaproteobacteria bacterium]
MRNTGRTTGPAGSVLQDAVRAVQTARHATPLSPGSSEVDLDSAAGSVRYGADQRAREIEFRLGLLVDALAGVFEDVQQPGSEFILAIALAEPSQYQIDSRAFVDVGPDLRTYRIVETGPSGPVAILESEDVEAVADGVTRLVAERIVDRQDREAGRSTSVTGGTMTGSTKADSMTTDSMTTGGWRSVTMDRSRVHPAGGRPDKLPSHPIQSRQDKPQRGPSQAMQCLFWAGAGFGLGVLAGIFLLLVYAWVAVG